MSDQPPPETHRRYARLRFGLFIVVIVAITLAVSRSSWWPLPAQKIPVGIGVDLPVMEGAAIDPSDWNAALLFVREHPGTRVDPIPVFVHPLPERAAPDLEAAMAEGKRFFVLTHASSLAVPSMHVFADVEALGIHIGATSLELSGRDDGLLRMIPDLRQEQLAMARQLERLPGGRLLVVQDLGNLAYTEPALHIFREALEADGRWQITLHPVDVARFRPDELEAILDGNHDALYLLAGAFLPPIGNIAQLFHHRYPEAPILLTPWARSPGVLEHSGAAIDRLRMLSHLPASGEDAVIDAFLDRFEAEFGRKPQALSISMYAALELLHAAFESGHTTPEAAKRYLTSGQTRETVLGPIAMDPFGDLQSDFHLINDLREELR